jgi:predicted ATPase/DNA-binding CsgD family transcriptional regulator/transcriptional regulator with XRE-family HTH domain
VTRPSVARQDEGIPERLRGLRERLGLSQERLAALLGVSFASVNRWERAATKPAPAMIARLDELEGRLAGPPLGASAAPRRRAAGSRSASAASTSAVDERPVTGASPAATARLRRLDGVPAAVRIPRPATSLIGRGQEVEALGALVRQHRLVTLTGPGGSGKTRVAIEVAEQAAERFGVRRWWVALGALTDPQRVPQTVARALEGRERADEAIPVTLGRAIAGEPALLVLDNAEHLAGAVAELVVALLAAAPALHVLVTSQVPLGVPGERRVPLGPLREDAVDLFVDRARANAPAFDATDADRVRIAELCRRLDGLPLAIELAAAWIPTLRVEELLARLGERFELLVGGTSLDLARHRTLRATVEWSRDRLLPADAVRLDRFGVFPGTFDLAAAEAVAGPATDPADGTLDGATDRPVVATVRELVSASLLQVETLETGTRYRLLETVRHFALEQLALRGELAAIGGLHARHQLVVVEAVSPRLQGPTLAAAMRELAAIEDDVRVALRWAWQPEAGVHPDPTGIGLRLVAVLGRFWYIAGRLREGLDWIERFAGPEPGASRDPELGRLRASALYDGAMLAAEAGRYALSETWGADSERSFVEIGDQRGAARAMNVQGSAAKYQGDLARAEERYTAALDVARGLGDPAGIAVALNNLGVLATESGAYGIAYERLSESLALKRAIGDERGIAVGLMNLGDVAVLRGDVEDADRLAAESLERFRSLGDKRGMGFSTNNLGEVARARGQHDRAAAHFAAALDLFREVGDQRDIALALLNLGRERIALGEMGLGRGLLVESLELARAIGDRTRVEEAQGALALAGGPPAIRARPRASQRERPGSAGAVAGGGSVVAGPPLTGRERDVLAELAAGRSNKEIGVALGIGTSTVERHVGNAYRKLGLASRVDAAAWAIRHGLGPRR